MKLTKIESLLEKYYKGESSLEDEKNLVEYFTGNHVIPDHLMIDQLHFRYYYRPAGSPAPIIEEKRKIS